MAGGPVTYPEIEARIKFAVRHKPLDKPVTVPQKLYDAYVGRLAWGVKNLGQTARKEVEWPPHGGWRIVPGVSQWDWIDDLLDEEGEDQR